jgi:uncharacterized protein (TIGR00266 family)
MCSSEDNVLILLSSYVCRAASAINEARDYANRTRTRNPEIIRASPHFPTWQTGPARLTLPWSAPHTGPRDATRPQPPMQYTIQGALAQTASLVLNPGDICWASKGALMSLDPDVHWTLKVPGGISGTVRRMLSGEGLALTYLEGRRPNEHVTLSANQPGKIIPWDLADGPVLTTRGSFVAAFGPQIVIDVTIARRAGAALFGGAGLFLQKVSGQGTVLVHGAGDFVDQHLGPGESMVVSTGNLAAFAAAIDYDIQFTGGIRRVLFSGEGLFMTRLTGPGRILLQTLKRARIGRTRRQAD